VGGALLRAVNLTVGSICGKIRMCLAGEDWGVVLMIRHNKLGKKPAGKLCSSIPSQEVDMITAGFCTPPVWLLADGGHSFEEGDQGTQND